MAHEIAIPEIGENVDSGEVVSVLVAEGDTVEVDQGILELETEKAVVEIPSPKAGRIKAIKVQTGDTVKVGQVVAVLEPDGEVQAAEEEGETPAEAVEGAAIEKRAEARAEEVEAQRPSTAGEEVKEQEPEKPEGTRPHETEPEETPEREEKAEYEKEEEQEEENQGAEEAETTEKPQAIRRLVPAAPAVRHLARELGVDIAKVIGSGPGERITARDVKTHAKDIIAGTHTAPVGRAQLPDFTTWGEIEREPLARVRRLTAESTGFSWMTVPHVTQFDTADIGGVEEFRRQHGRIVDERGGKLTITPILLKVVAAALARFPRFNASLDMERGEVIYKRYYHIGVAVATERGLLVPVVRDVDKKSINELAAEVPELARKARNKRISPAEMQGGTFTVSNQGGIGGTNFTPIVYWPQVAILGVSRAVVQPVFANGRVESRTALPLALSYDHRLIDGADAARFLRWISKALEHPLLLKLDNP
jgi:pyruvate dehydrogenase E2 component (dihydrolipoamide acetyltransferase)